MTQDPSNMDIPSLLALCAQLDLAIGGEGYKAYNVPADIAAAVASKQAALSASSAATESKRAAYLAQKGTRDADFRATATAVSVAARAIMASPSNTDAMILAAGLKPRSTSRTKVVPVTPTKLFATPIPSGDIKLDWARTGNAAGVNFVVEVQTPGGEWLFAGDTTATRLTVSGYAPGETVSFRVSASKNKITTTPSATATVFPAQSSSPALRLAA